MVNSKNKRRNSVINIIVRRYENCFIIIIDNLAMCKEALSHKFIKVYLGSIR